VGIIKATKLFSIFVLSILLLSTVSAYDLSDYPDMFIESGEFRGYFIVGDHADPLDVISTMDIAVTMQAAGQELGGKQISVTASRLASEVKVLDHNDAIVVGTPCDNEWIARLKNVENCEDAYNLKMGDAVIEYMRTNGNNYVIVTGYTSRDVRRASKVLAGYWNHPELNGYQVNINAGRIEVTKVNPGDNVLPKQDHVPIVVGKKIRDFIPKPAEVKPSRGLIAVKTSGPKDAYKTVSINNHVIVRQAVSPIVVNNNVEMVKAEPGQKVFVIKH